MNLFLLFLIFKWSHCLCRCWSSCVVLTMIPDTLKGSRLNTQTSVSLSWPRARSLLSTVAFVPIGANELQRVDLLAQEADTAFSKTLMSSPALCSGCKCASGSRLLGRAGPQSLMLSAGYSFVHNKTHIIENTSNVYTEKPFSDKHELILNLAFRAAHLKKVSFF